MLFNSVPFLILLCTTFGLFYLPALRRFQTPVLIVSSFVFYAYENPWLLALLCGSIAVNTLLSYAIVLRGLARRAVLVAAAILFNVLVLAFFKYSGFIYSSLFGGGKESSLGHFLVSIPLPIGISFYTFESISLIVDIIRHPDGRPDFVRKSLLPHLANTALFVSFFPHLISGPILKAHDFYPQIVPKRFRDIPWDAAFGEIVTGYFLKMVVADNLKDFTLWMEYPHFQSQPSGHLLALMGGFSCQIFADFAGYSLIALGVARLFGYKLVNNFNYPYISASLAEFWQRWHISLSQWLREYLYFPLGGNRKGPVRTYFNLFVVMAIGGLWHGAAFSYVVWGVFHGFGLAVERFVGDLTKDRPVNPWVRPLKIFCVFLFVTAAWPLFKFPQFSHLLGFYGALFSNTHLPSKPAFLQAVAFFCFPVVAYHAWHLFRPTHWSAAVEQWRPAAVAAMLFAILHNSGSAGRFLYFQF